MASDQLESFRAGVPGIYPGIPGADYHALDACSNSRMTELLESAELCRYRMDNPIVPTDAMDFGSGTHAWLLEPETLAEQFVVPGRCCATKKDGARCKNDGIYFDAGEWFCGVRGHKPDVPDPVDKIIISEDDWVAMQAIRDKVMTHPKAGPLVESQGDNELSVLETHEPTGQLCKLRVDISRPQIFADLKTTVSASPRRFQKTIFERGYFRQAGMYCRMAQKAGIDVEHFVFIAVEKKPPYCVATYRLLDDALQEGWREIERLLEVHRDCVSKDHWPGYSDEVTAIGLPEWAWYHLPHSSEPQWPGDDNE